MEIDKKKNQMMNEYEIRNKKEIDEFVTKINEMRINLENERQKELDALSLKYERIKSQLESLQKSESKRIDKMQGFKVTDMNDTMLNDNKSYIDKAEVNKSYVESKKKVLMNKIKKLNNKGYK